MGMKLLTIETANQCAYDKVLSNWLSAGATILQCGYVPDKGGTWWAIAEVDDIAKEKPCDIPERIAKRGSVPDAYWPWGDEEEHTFYYDFVMFE